MAKLDREEEEVVAEETVEDSGQSDAELVSMMGMKMLDAGGLQVIEKALKGSQEPAQVIGTFLAQMIGRMAEKTQEEFGIDPAVYAQPDGFLDQILNFIERRLELPPEFSDQIYGETLEVMKAAASGGEVANQPAPAGPAPAGPPGAPPPAGLDQGGV